MGTGAPAAGCRTATPRPCLYHGGLCEQKQAHAAAEPAIQVGCFELGLRGLRPCT